MRSLLDLGWHCVWDRCLHRRWSLGLRGRLHFAKISIGYIPYLYLYLFPSSCSCLGDQ